MLRFALRRHWIAVFVTFVFVLVMWPWPVLPTTTSTGAQSSTTTEAYALADRYVEQAQELSREGQFSAAIEIFEKFAEIERTSGHPRMHSLAVGLSGQADANKRLGRFAEAEELYREVLAIRREALPEDHPDIATSINDLADLLHTTGRYAEAEPLFQRALAIREQTLQPEHSDLTESLNALGRLYRVQGRYSDAEPHYQRALAIREQTLGPEHPDVAESVNNLAVLYQAQGRYAEAEPLYQRALAIWEQALGPEHPDVAQSLNNLAEFYRAQGRYAEADPLYQRALAIHEQALGPEHPDVAQSLNSLAALYYSQGRYAEAEPLFQRALVIWEQALGSEHPDVTSSLNNLAVLYRAQGRYAEAEPLHQRALAIDEKALGPEHPDVATSLNNLAGLYKALGRYAEAEQIYRRALAIREQALDPEHPDLAASLNNLAALYYSQGRYAEAEPLFQHALTIREQALGSEHPDVAQSLNNLAEVYHTQGRYAEAEPLLQRALAILEQALGTEHPDATTRLINLAGLYQTQGRYAEAKPLLQRALAILEQALGPEHPDVATSLGYLAVLYHTQGRYAEAEPLHQRALAIREQALGPEHPDVAQSLNNLAVLYQNQGRVTEALPLCRRVQAIDAERLRQRMAGKTGEGNAVQRDHALAYLYLLADLKKLTPEDQANSLTAVQLARSADSADVFQALAQRLAAGGRGELANLVRQRQDLLVQLQAAEKRLLDSYSLPAEQRSKELTNNLRAKIDRLSKQEQNLSERLQRDFPAYTEFEGTQLTDLAALQRALKPKEAAIAWVLGKDRAYRLIVRPKGEPSLHTASVSAEDIGASVQQLHQALDLADDSHYGTLADFPAATAHRLFTQLFGTDWTTELADIDHLLLVPEGTLTRLPFAALLTAPPQTETFPALGEDHQDAPWLAERFALSILPSLSAIPSLRTQDAANPADRPFIGIGDPLLKDHPAKMRGGRTPKPEQLALVRNAHGLERVQQIASAENLRQSRLEQIRQLDSLPDTADELEVIAKLFDAEPTLLLREAATESELKQRPLDDYRIVSFATHGVLAGELGQGIEPGLILTPPDKASDQDDGFLSLSEVAQLKLNSDWVVLSACNTAGGAQREAESLTGLAKAFIYAGTKSLLASHWAVSSQGTVALMSRLFKHYQDQHIPRAQAHREAMRQMIASGSPLLRHPSMWAPFVVVGDGG